MLGVFDSGFGGLTVLKAIRNILPELSIMYLGDSARTPYGNRDRATVTQYTKECCELLFEQGCTLIVLACNTASADTLRELQQEWLPTVFNGDRNIIGVVLPLAEEAARLSRNGVVSVLGTEGTVASQAYVHELGKLRPEVQVIQQACPLLVPLIEEGWKSTPETRKIVHGYLTSIKAHNPDVMILGCTHYEMLHNLISEKMGSRCTVLHSPSVVAHALKEYITRHPEYVLERKGKTRFFTTGDIERFAALGSRFMGLPIENVEKMQLRLVMT